MGKSLKITSGATHVVSDMTLSCGNDDCEKTIAILNSVTSTVPLESIAVKEDGSWRVALDRLHGFIASKNLEAEAADVIEVIDEFEAALYFGSGYHVEIMFRKGWERLGYYLGLDAGLITHVLLPISEAGFYTNAGHRIKLKGWIDLGGKGKPFYHLGTVTRLALSDDQINEIKAEQAASTPFMKALAKLDGGIIETPPEYLAGIECNAR